MLERRGDVPPRLALAIERAMAKRPEDLHPWTSSSPTPEWSLRELDGYGDDSERTLVVPAAARRGRRPRRRRPPIFLILLALGVLLLPPPCSCSWTARTTTTATRRAAPPPSNVRLTATSAYDPEGTGGEHDSEVPLATDGNPATFWRTEDYRDFTKSGVGIVVAANQAVALDELTVTTDTPGFPARIRASTSAGGGFVDVSDEQPTTPRRPSTWTRRTRRTATTSSAKLPGGASPMSTR